MANEERGQGEVRTKIELARRAAAERFARPESRTLQGRANNLLGFGIGTKVTRGTHVISDEPCVRFYVRSKVPTGTLSTASQQAPWFIPREIGGLATDVVAVGRVRPFQSPSAQPGAIVSFVDPNVGHSGLDYGALGAFVRYGGGMGFLTCNHVIAWNGRVPAGSQVTLHTPTAEEIVIGELDRFLELREGQENPADCALARVTEGAWKSLAFEGIDAVTTQVAPVELYTPVLKLGPMSGVTRGRIVDVDATIEVDYDFGTFVLGGQIAIESEDELAFARDGDSGAVVFADQGGVRSPVGMVWGGKKNLTFASPMTSCLAGIGGAEIVISESALSAAS